MNYEPSSMNHELLSIHLPEIILPYNRFICGIVGLTYFGDLSLYAFPFAIFFDIGVGIHPETDFFFPVVDAHAFVL